jgi:hypothetical protein
METGAGYISKSYQGAIGLWTEGKGSSTDMRHGMYIGPKVAKSKETTGTLPAVLIRYALA